MTRCTHTHACTCPPCEDRRDERQLELDRYGERALVDAFMLAHEVALERIGEAK